jgi:hypothetical protein
MKGCLLRNRVGIAVHVANARHYNNSELIADTRRNGRMINVE